MAAITLRQIEAAFQLAADVFDGKMAPGGAAKQLHSSTGLNLSSSRDFVSQYRHMLKGEVFKRSLSAEALKYFLAKILDTRGPAAAERALVATWKHIAYYESLQRGNLNRLAAVASAFQSSLEGHRSAEVVDAAFVAAVSKSQHDSELERRARLEKADPIPATLVVTKTIFRRNPDVIAAVLARAKGLCEGCRKPAPFSRRSDSSPFLEVHHHQQLADHGPDTVENAIALCPNCHRKAHYG